MPDPIPVKVRTARKPHQCSEFGCNVPILPGERYEHTVWPPMRNEYAQSDRWLTWRSHYPRTGPDNRHLWGCDLAAAYAENERRELAAKEAVA